MEPIVSEATPIKALHIGPHEAMLFGDIKSRGIVQYNFVLVAYDENRVPALYLCSEWNPLLEKSDGRRTHYLGVFSEDGHSNLGDSDDWKDPYIFTLRAILEMRKYFGVAVGKNLSDGEVWALLGMFEELDRAKGDDSGEADSLRERYLRVVRTYESRIARYLQSE